MSYVDWVFLIYRKKIVKKCIMLFIMCNFVFEMACQTCPKFFVVYFSLFSKCLNFIEIIYIVQTQKLLIKKKKNSHTNSQPSNCKKHKTIEDNRKLLIVAN